MALTNDDQVNLLTTMLARNEGCERALCLINNTSFLPLGQSIGLDISINPRAITVSSVLQHIRKGHVLAVHTIEDGEAEIIEAEVLETSAFCIFGYAEHEFRLILNILMFDRILGFRFSDKSLLC